MRSAKRNANSDLYRQHPDWVINFAGRPRTEARNQLALNLARTDVRDHILAVLDRLVNQNDVALLKWDINRRWTEPGWPEVAPQDQQRRQPQLVERTHHQPRL